MSAIELSSVTFEQEVLRSDIPVLVDFWAPWCRPCQMMAPILDELAFELAGRFKITKLDVDNPAHMALAEQYKIQGIPNMQIFKDGKVVDTLIGARPKVVLKAELYLFIV